MSLWWLEPGWKDATCGVCGCNIWKAGGDPDHGLCPTHWQEQWERDHPTVRRYPVGWFVRDFGDGWIFFNDEGKARQEAAATGAAILVAYNIEEK
jgi:hypothetical protein